MDEVILWKIEDNIGKIILNHPPSNPMSGQFFKRLKFIIEKLIPASEIDGIIISGTGRHYSSGANLTDLFGIIKHDTVFDGGKIACYPEMILDNINVFKTLYEMKMPVVSLIKGVCIGSGLELALFSHFRFCSEESIFGLPETTFNLMPGCGGILRLVELAGLARALELVLHGNLFPSKDALRYGIVDRIFPKRSLFEKAAGFISETHTGYDMAKAADFLKRNY
jgi:enoyl-CoA hydratase/carnithine racemase